MCLICLHLNFRLSCKNLLAERTVTPPSNMVILRKSVVGLLYKKFLSFYGNRRSISVCKTTCSWSLFCTGYNRYTASRILLVSFPTHAKAGKVVSCVQIFELKYVLHTLPISTSLLHNHNQGYKNVPIT